MSGQGFYGFPNILGLLRGTNLKVLGKAGATAGAGLAGGTTSGAPTSGSFDVGEAVIGQDGTLFVCTVAGSPGTWVQLGTLVDPMSVRGDLIVRGASSSGRLALGTSGQVLQSNGTDALWGALGATSGGALTNLGETILGSDTATITFSSISASYRDLLLHLTGRSTASAFNAQVLMQFNSDTGNNYDWSTSVLRGTSTTGGTTAGTTSSLRTCALPAASSAASVASGMRIRIQDYARTQWFKAFHAEGSEHQDTGVNNTFFDLAAGQWRSTAAITTITLSLSAGSFKTGTVATLWGVS